MKQNTSDAQQVKAKVHTTHVKPHTTVIGTLRSYRAYFTHTILFQGAKAYVSTVIVAGITWCH